MYIVGYDLTRRAQEYDELWDGLDALGAKRVMRSQWVVDWNRSAEELHDRLRSLVNENDRLLVNAIGEHAWSNLIADPKRS